jgi:hypothetical protein
MPAMLAHARAALAALLLLCAAASASAAASDAKAASASGELETMDIASWTLEQKAFGAPHTRAEYELPRGVKRGSPAADAYFRRWLQCSTLVTWCTVKEVACGCVLRSCELAIA